MKENNSPLENLKDEYKMLLQRQRLQQNKWIKCLGNKMLNMIRNENKVMTDKEKLMAIRAEISRLVKVRGYQRGMANDLFTFMDSLPNEPVISDSRKANRAKFIKELKQKIDSYERELAKSGDSTKCDDVDWVTLSSDMFDMLQKCLLNF